MRVPISILEFLAACCLLLAGSVGAYCCWSETAMYYCHSNDFCDPEKCYEVPSTNIDFMIKLCNWKGSP